VALDQLVALPDGSKALVTGEAQDIASRVKHGDPTLGWEGDPDMTVCVAPYRNRLTGHVAMLFEVWAIDAHRQPYVAVTSDTCGPELIRQLVRADVRKRDVVAEAIKANERRERSEAADRSARHEEMADKLHLALVKENTPSGRRIY
jgi:hypothetical protein